MRVSSRGEPGPQYAIAVSLPLGPSRLTAETRQRRAETRSRPFSVTSGPGAGRTCARKPPNATDVPGGQVAVALSCAPFGTVVDAETVRSSGRRPQYARTVRVPVPGRSEFTADATARRPPAPRLVSSSAAFSPTVAFSPRNIARVGGGQVVMTVPRLPGGTLTVPLWMVRAAADAAQASARIVTAAACLTRRNLADTCVEAEVHGRARRCPDAHSARPQRAATRGRHGVAARLESNAIAAVCAGLDARGDLAVP
jgi:hypothetical protein